MLATIVVVFAVIFFISLIVSFIIYKKMRLESKLLDCWWKIDWEDLEFYENKKMGRKSAVSLATSDASFLSKT